MIIVDSHCHVSPVWYEPVETLLHQMDRHGVEHAILIQIQGQFNNDYQSECLGRFPGRFASVVVLDTDRADAVQQLEREAERGASGLRLRPGVRSPGDEPLAIWRAAARLGLSISCGGTASDFASDAFAETIQALPELKIVVEHLGSVNHPNDGDSPQHDIRRKVFELARFPNVYIKVPGLGEFARRALPVVEPFPFEQPIPPLLELAYQAFGPQRLMWGSDYPPSSGREGYGNALRLPMEEFVSKSEADRSLIFGGVALDVFPVRG
jgi:L-fuconolactonase